MSSPSKSPGLASVQERVKAKIRGLPSPATSRSAKSTPSPGKRTSPIVISSGEELSDSTSDDEDEGAEYNSDTTTKKSSRKMDPDPNVHYSVSEVKKFANMAKTIRNVDEAKGHSHAVADFIDLEFSDNSGMMAKARRSKDAWTKLRFETACNKAVRIMEERCVYYACIRIRHDQFVFTLCSQHYTQPCTGSAYLTWAISSRTQNAKSASEVSIAACPNYPRTSFGWIWVRRGT